MSKVYDDPKYNAAFDRCVDVMSRLLQKYGPQLLGRCRRLRMLAAHVLWFRESNPFRCIRNLTKPLDINLIYTLRICLAYAYNKYATCIFALWGKRNGLQNQIKELRESTGMNRKEFCKIFRFPIGL